MEALSRQEEAARQKASQCGGRSKPPCSECLLAESGRPGHRHAVPGRKAHCSPFFERCRYSLQDEFVQMIKDYLAGHDGQPAQAPDRGQLGKQQAPDQAQARARNLIEGIEGSEDATTLEARAHDVVSSCKPSAGMVVTQDLSGFACGCMSCGAGGARAHGGAVARDGGSKPEGVPGGSRRAPPSSKLADIVTKNMFASKCSCHRHCRAVARARPKDTPCTSSLSIAAVRGRTRQLVDKIRQDLAERGGQPAQAHDQGQQGQQQAPDQAQAQDEKMNYEMGQAHPGQQER